MFTSFLLEMWSVGHTERVLSMQTLIDSLSPVDIKKKSTGIIYKTQLSYKVGYRRKNLAEMMAE